MKPLAALTGLLALAEAAATPAAERKVSYDGYKVVRLAVGDQAARLNGIVADLGLSTWKGAAKPGGLADVVVPPDRVGEFEALTADLDATTMHDDLGASMADEGVFRNYAGLSPPSAPAPQAADLPAAGSANLSWWDSYHPYADHLQWLGDLQAAYPDNSRLVVSGTSLEGRDITGIHIYGDDGGGEKKAVVFHGTVHAREWISTMVTEYLAYQLLSGSHGFADRYDFYIFPVVNPDGFVFTQTTDRLWRKNRQTNSGTSCVGRDINRNYPFQWNSTGGSSREPCAQDYRGVQQADAPETEVLTRHLRRVSDRQGLKLFVDFHSYGQYFMAPYGYNCERKLRNAKDILNLGAGAVKAMNAAFGSNFQAGSICNMLYMSTGCSVDFAFDVARAEYSYTLELRDQGSSGFVLPPAQILPSGQETWAGIKYAISHMK